MLDSQIFGLNARGHHVTNVLIHAANSVLVFIWLGGLTGARWRSAIVAALFALHPLHVESVAWISERKDVLSAFFGLVCLIAYTTYTRSSAPKRWRYYAVAFVALALGLLSKPMLVTWPFVMLLLDYWPLGRSTGCVARVADSKGTDSEEMGAQIQSSKAFGLLVEKIPFFALSVMACLIALATQKAGGAMPTLEQMPIGGRIANAAHSYVGYIWKTLVPVKLAVIYPTVQIWPAWEIALDAVILFGISAFVWWQRRKRPYLIVGWAWFIGTLVPVIGLVQVGNQAMADRYAYLPGIGLLLMIVWGANEWTMAHARFRTPALAAVPLLIALCAWGTIRQTGYWKDSRALFEHAIEVTQNNFIAHNNLAYEYSDSRDFGTAKKHLQSALEINPASDVAWAKLATIRIDEGDLKGARDACMEALRWNTNSADAHANLGMIYVKQGRLAQGIAEYQTAVRLRPWFSIAHYNLANALVRQGMMAEALEEFRQAVRWDPQSADAHNNYAFLLAGAGRLPEAAEEFRKALALQPGLWRARYGLGNALERMGQHEEAAQLLSEVRRDHPELFRKGPSPENGK
jgi:tetratricopeptide (TPR) repeat protein